MVVSRRSVRLLDGRSATLVRETLPPGDAGIRRTLRIMAELARRDAQDPRVQAIVAKHRKPTAYATAQALWAFMVKNYRYTSDPPDREHVTAPVYLLTKTSPFDYQDCDDLASSYAALLTPAGIANRFKVISWRRTNPPLQYTHVYNEFQDPATGHWIPVDLVMRKDGWANERRPVFRSETYHVADSSEGLADPVEYGAVNYELIGKDILTRAMPAPFGKGENVGNVLREHVVAICIGNVRQQIYDNRHAIAAAVGAGAILMGTVGYVAALAVERRRAGVRPHEHNRRRAA